MFGKRIQKGARDGANFLEQWRGLSLWEAACLVFRLIGDVLSVFILMVIVFTTFFYLALDCYGERHWLLGMLLYLPSYVWLIPSLLLLPLSLVFCFRYFVVLSFFIVGCGYYFSGYQFSGKEVILEMDSSFTLVTNNVGNDRQSSIDTFAERHSPDIMVFQESRPEQFYREKYPDLNIRSEGEFVLVTSLNIVEAGLLNTPTWGAFPIAARYVLEFESGQRLVVYNIHLPTRRFFMNRVWGKGLLPIIFGGGAGSYGSQVRIQNRDFFAGQIEMINRLIDQAEGETYPIVLAGDFNVPARGHIYGILNDAFRDSFVDGGRGFGFTFPGDSRKPLAFFHSWLRIDHAFASEELSTNYAEVEKGRPSQHRALAVSWQFR
jgi:vancomycin resistance protein VanJ